MKSWVSMSISILLFLISLAACNSSSRQLCEQAEARWREGKYEDAVRLYQLLYDRDHQGWYAAQALLKLGDIYYLNQRQLEDAIKTYGRVVDEFPGKPEEIQAHRQLAIIYANEVRDLNMAIGEYDRLLEIPNLENREEIEFQRANAYFNKGETDRALRELSHIAEGGIRGHLADQVYLKIGTIYQIQKKFDISTEMFQRVAEAPCMECRHRALLGLAESYEALFQFDKAIESLRKLDATTENKKRVNLEIKRLTEKRGRIGSSTALSWDWRHR